jgi:hypothetical protein
MVSLCPLPDANCPNQPRSGAKMSRAAVGDAPNGRVEPEAIRLRRQAAGEDNLPARCHAFRPAIYKA